MNQTNEAAFSQDKKRLQQNLQTIHNINIALTVAGVGCLVAIFSTFFLDIDFFIYLLIIGLLAAGLASYFCSKLAGHGMLELDELGGGCGTLFMMPLYFAMYFFFIVTGWVYGIMARSRLRTENQEIIARHGPEILQ